jgi:beta-glucosidase
LPPARCAGSLAVVAEPFREPSRTPAERARDLLGRLSLDEKLAQLGCVWGRQLAVGGRFSEARAGELLRHGIGHVARIGASTSLRPRESAAFANRIQRFLVGATRLGIPAVVHEESCAGLTARDATQFPQAIGVAASFAPQLAEAMGELIRAQMRAVGARHTLAPVLDVARDPRWGRVEESFGEDPYLAARMGVAVVRGLQGGSLASGVVATGKHFLGYGLSEGGLNHAPAHLGPRELRDVFARPFAAAIQEAGLASVMNAYQEIDGLPCAGSPALLRDLLRGELGFEGVVVADYFAIPWLETFHRVAEGKAEAASLALEAGIDVELPGTDCYGAPLREALQRGLVAEARVDEAVLRVLEQKLALGLFERPFVDEERAAEVFDTPPQRALARELARQSLVLLRNEGDLLPLAPRAKRLAVIGPHADDVRLLLGDYSYPAHLEMAWERPGAAPPAPAETSSFEATPCFVPMVSILAGLRAAAPPGTRIAHARGCDVTGDDRSGFADAVAAAHDADVVVLAVGGKSGLTRGSTSGEFRDAAALGLPGVQQELAEAVLATGTPCVAVVVSGRPLALPWLAEHARALLFAWLPGEEGGRAVADVLFGHASPGGRLPVTLPRAVGQVPLHYDHKSGGGRSQMLGDYVDLPVSPLFPFGHGLSYGRFAYGPLEIEPAVTTAFGPVRVSLDVVNEGERGGDEVVQLYLRDVVGSVTRPVRQLAGFVRLALVPGERRRVHFRLDPAQLAFHDARFRHVVEPGEVRVMVGPSSAEVRAEATLRIEGKVREIGFAELVPTSVEVR